MVKSRGTESDLRSNIQLFQSHGHLDATLSKESEDGNQARRRRTRFHCGNHRGHDSFS
ncbi:hypothetical protein BN2475_310140 [Paraburkholderia ribeironis]|uniref:Uncharacterized protein n=1 Tax=Paraburkholderia ribeironis TaxID=1247936 RepID=A0A1N7S2N3_9BURK|nr:hypothetical protein BN2475_310140 [Paraburkholderia ribeironis]